MRRDRATNRRVGWAHFNVYAILTIAHGRDPGSIGTDEVALNRIARSTGSTMLIPTSEFPEITLRALAVIPPMVLLDAPALS